MKIADLKEKALKLISEGKIPSVLTFLLSNMGKSSKISQHEVIIYRSRYNELSSAIRSGEINQDEYEKRLNELTNTISNYVHDVFETPSELAASAKEQAVYKKSSLKDAFSQKRKILVPLAIIVGVLIACFLVGIYSSLETVSALKNIKYIFTQKMGMEIILLLLIISSSFFVYFLLMQYLTTREEEKIETEFEKAEKIAKKEEEIKKYVSELVVINQEEKENLVDVFKEQITSDVSELVNKEALSTILSETRYNEVDRDFQSLEKRLKTEITDLNKKATTNLVIGIIFTSVSLIILGLLSLHAKSSFENWLDFAAYFLPKITMLVFIEIFSFYFLRLYKLNLDEIKYYQNELTDVNFKILSLKSALLRLDDETVRHISKELIGIERNKILKKDETSAAIERYKAENEFNKGLLDKLLINLNLKDLLGNNKEDKVKQA